MPAATDTATPEPRLEQVPEDEAVEEAGPTLDIMTWSRAVVDASATAEGDLPAVATDVVAVDSGFLAVGFGDWTAVVWRSDDGRSWSRSPPDVAFEGVLPRSMHAVTVSPDGVVAVGVEGAPGSRGEGAAMAWTSIDGRNWSETVVEGSIDPRVGGGRHEMNDVILTEAGLVAVGQGGAEASSNNAAVWTSVDGRAWVRVPHDERVFGGRHGHAWMQSVTRGGPGLVAVGNDGPFQSDSGGPVAWVSVDGLTWTRSEIGGTNDQLMGAVTAGGPGLVSVGWDAGRDAAAVWTSTDGTSWFRLAHDEQVFGNSSRMDSVVNTGAGLIAVGSDSNGAAVWTSADGLSWSRIAGDATVFGHGSDTAMLSVIVSDGRLIAVGLGDGPPGMWTAP